MSKKIENPAECEVRAVIRFLNAQNVRPIEISIDQVRLNGFAEGILKI
jgi:hypothetical protein